ncbi:MAG: leucyl aminopeptidase [Burkholderiales bacterium]
MEFSIKSGNPAKQHGACVVVGVFLPRILSDSGEALDKASKGYIADIIRRGDLEGKLGSTLILHKIPGLQCDRVMLVGLGRKRDFHDQQYRTAISAAVKTLNETGSLEASLYLSELPVPKRDAAWKVEQAVVMAMEAVYRFDKMKSKSEDVRRPLHKLTIEVASRTELRAGEQAIAHGLAIARGMNLAKDLGNLPPNICTPTYLAEQAKTLAKELGLKAKILDRDEIEKLGMGSFLSVTNGSRQPPKLICLEYNGGGKKDQPHVLVGKGITFDTGGISLKPGAEMDEMKYDMCGAASVLGTIQAVAELKLPINVVGIIPTCENMPDGLATRPGDVVTSMSGQTVEILNTDAEGRLILCDALTYAERYKPATVVDIATLTGACVIALGHVASGLYANQDSLAKELLSAGEYSQDRAWHMPLWDEYQDALRSNFADMANIGGRAGGSITAACFLSRYTKKYHWAHLDIAGTAWKSGTQKGGTGRPVPLLTRFLINQSEK